MNRACGLSHVTITKGLHERDEAPLPPGRVRRAGGGRWRLELGDPELPERLEALVEPLTRGDPQSSLRWTIRSTRVLAAELTADEGGFNRSSQHLMSEVDDGRFNCSVQHLRQVLRQVYGSRAFSSDAC